MEDRFLSHAHALEIGRLAVNVSKLDSLLTDLISAITSTHIIYTIIMVHHQQFANKVDTLLSLMRLILGDLADDELERLIAPINNAKAVSDFRNTVVHAAWLIDDEGNATAVRFQARGVFKNSKTPLSVEDIREQVDKSGELVQTLSEMRDHFHKRPNSLED